MLVVCGYTNLRPEVQAALAEHAPDAWVRSVAGDERAYHRLLCEAWAAGTDMLVVEHDIVLEPHVIGELDACDEPWCGFVYDLAVGYKVCLGCTRFASALVQAEPNAMLRAGDSDNSGVNERAWYRIDVRLDRILRDRGYTPHPHWPPLRHLNDTNRMDPEQAALNAAACRLN